MSTITSTVIEDRHFPDCTVTLEEFTKHYGTIGAPSQTWWKVCIYRAAEKSSGHRINHKKAARIAYGNTLQKFEQLQAAAAKREAEAVKGLERPKGWARF